MATAVTGLETTGTGCTVMSAANTAPEHPLATGVIAYDAVAVARELFDKVPLMVFSNVPGDPPAITDDGMLAGVAQLYCVPEIPPEGEIEKVPPLHIVAV